METFNRIDFPTALFSALQIISFFIGHLVQNGRYRLYLSRIRQVIMWPRYLCVLWVTYIIYVSGHSGISVKQMYSLTELHWMNRLKELF